MTPEVEFGLWLNKDRFIVREGLTVAAGLAIAFGDKTLIDQID